MKKIFFILLIVLSITVFAESPSLESNASLLFYKNIFMCNYNMGDLNEVEFLYGRDYFIGGITIQSSFPSLFSPFLIGGSVGGRISRKSSIIASFIKDNTIEPSFYTRIAYYYSFDRIILNLGLNYLQSRDRRVGVTAGIGWNIKW